MDAEASDDWGLPKAPPSEIAARETARLVAWARDELERGEVPSLIVVALFLREFVRLRPFADANGRLALVLAVYLLVRAGYTHLREVSLEAAIESRRDECAAALRRTTGDDVTPWIIFFLSIVAETQQMAKDARHCVNPLTPRQERLLASLRERGAAKIGDLIVAAAVPRATAKKDLRGLLETGFIVRSGTGKATVYRPGPRREI
jgi:Fic family protein